MSNLSKLFVSVPNDKVTAFLAAYGPDATSRSDAYDKKICFLGTSGQIFAQGQLYGGQGADTSAIEAMLAGIGGTDQPATVMAAITAAKTAVLGSADSANTVDSVAGRVAAIEALVEGDDPENNTIDKLKEIIAWFANQEEGSTAADIISKVNANTTAIGAKAVAASADYAPAVYYTQEEIDAASEGDAAFGKTTADVKTAQVGTAAVEASGLYKEIADAVANLDAVSVATDSANYLEANSGVLTVKTSTLSGVSLTKATEGENAGKWVAGTATTDTGLATAADVAAELVADEEVIASALNDHESRIKANESAIGTAKVGDTPGTGLTGRIEALEAWNMWEEYTPAQA